MDAIEERFWAKVEKTDGCWLWTGAKQNGYGKFNSPTSTLAYRVAFEFSGFSVPSGMKLDHVCHSTDVDCRGGPTCSHRACVRPSHLQVVTQKENVQRGAAVRFAKTRELSFKKRGLCPKGHPRTESYVSVRGKTVCRPCRSLRLVRFRSVH